MANNLNLIELIDYEIIDTIEKTITSKSRLDENEKRELFQFMKSEYKRISKEELLQIETHYIDLREILIKRDITEFESIEELSNQLLDLLNDEDKINCTYIIICNNDIINRFKTTLLVKDKIKKKIYFNSDFKKPLSILQTEANYIF